MASHHCFGILQLRVIYRHNTAGPNNNKVFILNITHSPLTRSHSTAFIHFLLPPLALQLGEALAHVIHGHFEELVGQILVILRVTGGRVKVVDERLPLYWLQNKEKESMSE